MADSISVRLLRRVGWVPFACAILAVLVLAVAGITWQTSPYWGHNPQAVPRNVGTVPTRTYAFSDPSVSTDPAPAMPPTPPPSPSSPTATATTPTAPTAPTAPAPAHPPAPAAVAAVAQVSPDRIVIPRLGASAPIVPVATTPDGELDVPLDPRVVGWWRYGAKPGATTGTAILAGHINYAGVTGSMARIGTLDPGDLVYVLGRYDADPQRTVRFRVTGVRTYHKTALPYQQIFDQRSVGRIAIVTCGGPFDARSGNYLDNVVVFAVPA